MNYFIFIVGCRTNDQCPNHLACVSNQCRGQLKFIMFSINIFIVHMSLKIFSIFFPSTLRFKCVLNFNQNREEIKIFEDSKLFLKHDLP